MKSKSTRFAILAASALAITFVHAADYDYTGLTAGDWGLNTNWTPNGVPGTGDTITINKDLPASATVVNYSASGVATRQISSISVTDTNTATEQFYTFAAGVAGSQLEFNTASPAISTNLVNVSSTAQRLVIVNPLFSQPSTSIAFGGVGNSALEFNVAAGNTAFNTNVTGLTCASTGVVVLYNKVAGTPITLPDFSFGSNNKLVLSSGPFSATGRTIGNGTGTLTVGGNASLTLGTGTVFAFGGLVTSSNNSADFYVNGAATVNVNGASGSFTSLNVGQNMSSSATSSFNVIDGAVTVSGVATVGAPNGTVSTNAVENLNINVSGGSLTFTQGTNFDFNVGRNDRSATGSATTLTVNGALTVSGGLLDLGSFGRLVVGRDGVTVPGNSSGDNTTGTINLNGGTLKTGRAIVRGGYTAGQTGADFAKVFFNGGTLQVTANPGVDLITGFGAVGMPAADGVFISGGGVIINTDVASGITETISASLKENPSNTGGGLTKQGPATLYLTGTASTFTGPIFVDAGTLAFSNTGAFGSGTAAITEAGATSLRLNGSATISRPIVTSGHNANTYNSNAAYNVTLKGGITQDPAYTPGITDVYGLESVGTTVVDTAPINIPGLQINKGQVGTLQLNVAGNIYRRLWLYTGTIKTGIAGALDPAAQIDLRTTASVLDLNGFSQTVGSLTGTTANGSGSSITSATAATLGISPATGSSTYAGTISGALGIAKSGAGTQILSGPNTYSGETAVTQGILGLSTDDTLSDAAAVRIAASGTTLDLTFAGEDVVDSFYIGAVQQASGKWGRIGAIAALGADHETALITGDGLLSVTNGSVAGNYNTWASANGVTGGPNGDSDNDGISNLVEYALALNHAGSDGSPGTLVGTTLTFYKRLEAYNNGDVTYVIEASTDLGVTDPWTAVTPTTNNPSVISFDLSGPAARNFARFKTVVTP